MEEAKLLKELRKVECVKLVAGEGKQVSVFAVRRQIRT